ncbi:hypothetical protein Vi05172_g10855 [Venturia inaequalis]|nr:hypothetical protein Vi05172_g10844 [Venturia inaequalis]RDI79118.1 hypothetical protein Vi05172_g10855 [Venturia inaequalis]
MARTIQLRSGDKHVANARAWKWSTAPMRRHEKMERTHVFQKLRRMKDKVRAPVRGFFFRSGYRRVKTARQWSVSHLVGIDKSERMYLSKEKKKKKKSTGVTQSAAPPIVAPIVAPAVAPAVAPVGSLVVVLVVGPRLLQVVQTSTASPHVAIGLPTIAPAASPLAIDTGRGPSNTQPPLMTADTEDSPVTTDSTDDMSENNGDGGMDGSSSGSAMGADDELGCVGEQDTPQKRSGLPTPDTTPNIVTRRN